MPQAADQGRPVSGYKDTSPQTQAALITTGLIVDGALVKGAPCSLLLRHPAQPMSSRHQSANWRQHPQHACVLADWTGWPLLEVKKRCAHFGFRLRERTPPGTVPTCHCSPASTQALPPVAVPLSRLPGLPPPAPPTPPVAAGGTPSPGEVGLCLCPVRLQHTQRPRRGQCHHPLSQTASWLRARPMRTRMRTSCDALVRRPPVPQGAAGAAQTAHVGPSN
jgi:hypothetical protein